jgi:hypothetical protein
MEAGGGLVGSINTGGMTHAVGEGYASASTDTGHTGSSGRFALGHPDKITDFAHRAVHETAVEAKALIAAYYGRSPRLRLLMTALKSPQHGLPAEKLKLLNDAVLDKCDSNDGVKDRLIEPPGTATLTLTSSSATVPRPQAASPRSNWKL